MRNNLEKISNRSEEHVSPTKGAINLDYEVSQDQIRKIKSPEKRVNSA